MSETIFSKIIDGEIPSHKVYEDEYVYAFLDISQVTKGHTLLIPKKASANIFETDSETMKHIGVISIYYQDMKMMSMVLAINGKHTKKVSTMNKRLKLHKK